MFRESNKQRLARAQPDKFIGKICDAELAKAF